MKSLRSFVAAALLAAPPLFVTPAAAQSGPVVADVRRAPPALFVEGTAERVGLERATIEARIVGHLAETRMTLTFGNTSGRRLAGDLYVPLPPEATVSGYALDVAGRLVDGVIVKKDEARRIFEKEVRKGVDPGLVEWTRGNVFKTRVFPIPPNGSRTVRLSWVAPLDAGAGGAVYRLPLAFPKLSELAIRVEVVRGEAAPIVTGAGPITLKFDERLVAEAKIVGQAVTQDLAIAVPDVGRRPVQVQRAADGQAYFAIHDPVAAPAGEVQRLQAKRVRVLWDASLSRAGSDRNNELALLAKVIAPGAEVELVVVRHEAEAPRVFTDLASLTAAIEALAWDGGTQLARLAPPPGARPVDMVLVFSDGLSTYGDDAPGALGAPTWTISSSRAASVDTLKKLAADNGGAFVDLARRTPTEAALVIGRPTWTMRAEVEDGVVNELLPSRPSPAGGDPIVAGALPGERAVVRVSWGWAGRKPEVVRRYEVKREAASTGEVTRLAFAGLRLTELAAEPERNADALVALGKQHGLVTPGTSLLVLETIDQYLEHRVRPPASWPELRAEWDRRIEDQRVAADKTEAERLEQVLAMWKEEVAWYERAFTYPPGFRYRDQSAEKTAESHGGVAPPPPRPMMAPEPSSAEEERESRDEPRTEAPKKKEDKGGGDETPPEPGVALTPWDPKTPWTAALKAAAPAQRFAVYLAQREQHGTAPSFYLDCADFFLSVKDEATALQVLSNIAELRLDDPALLRVLAHRLAQLEQLSTAARLFEVVLRLRPEEPQSHRDLALVLGRRADKQASTIAARADWQAALDHLAAIVKRRWDRFEAIEIIALTELNGLWPKAKAAGATLPLDARFIHPMELDTRIVMTWDADQTDMDLHVLEPSGEEAYYGHNLTTIGGRVSRDFTQGYGPEVYALRKSMHGTYQVKTKFFGSSAAELIGAVTLQVDVFTNWGRPNEKRRSMTLRLTEKKEDFVVGTLEF